VFALGTLQLYLVAGGVWGPRKGFSDLIAGFGEGKQLAYVLNLELKVPLLLITASLEAEHFEQNNLFLLLQRTFGKQKYLSQMLATTEALANGSMGSWDRKVFSNSLVCKLTASS
jgi:hypothetical protein